MIKRSEDVAIYYTTAFLAPVILKTEIIWGQ